MKLSKNTTLGKDLPRDLTRKERFDVLDADFTTLTFVSEQSCSNVLRGSTHDAPASPMAWFLSAVTHFISILGLE